MQLLLGSLGKYATTTQQDGRNTENNTTKNHDRVQWVRQNFYICVIVSTNSDLLLQTECPYLVMLLTDVIIFAIYNQAARNCLIGDYNIVKVADFHLARWVIFFLLEIVNYLMSLVVFTHVSWKLI